MATKNEQALQAQIDELSRRLAVIEGAPIPQLQEAQKRATVDTVWYAARAIWDEPDDAKRAAALLAADHETRRMFWEHACADAGKAYDTARLLPAGQRGALVKMAPQSLQGDMMVFCLPVPARVRVFLRSDVTSWSSSAIKGATKAQDYPGLRLTSRTKATTEGGAVERVFTVQVFQAMCERDTELRDAITRGVVEVENLSEDASRAMLRDEIGRLSEAEKPRIVW